MACSGLAIRDSGAPAGCVLWVQCVLAARTGLAEVRVLDILADQLLGYHFSVGLVVCARRAYALSCQGILLACVERLMPGLSWCRQVHPGASQRVPTSALVDGQVPLDKCQDEPAEVALQAGSCCHHALADVVARK